MAEGNEAEIAINIKQNPSYVVISRHWKGIKTLKDSYCQGYVESNEELEEFLKEFRVASGVSFMPRDSITKDGAR